MILYRVTARLTDDFVYEWTGSFNQARREAKKLAPLSLDNVYIDKLVLPGRDEVAWAMNHAHSNRSVMPGVQMTVYEGGGTSEEDQDIEELLS
jgi:hypothetical protein